MTTDNEAAAVEAALDRMDALLDPKCDLLSVPYDSATVQASRADMATIRAAIAAHTAASAGEARPFGWTATDNRRCKIEFTNLDHVAEAWKRDPHLIVEPLYTAPPAAVPADALELLSHAQASIRGLIAEIDPARKPATGELKLIADQLRDTLAALIPKGADHGHR